MSTPKEATIVRNILAYLRGRGDCWVFKVHGGAMQAAGVPDLIGVCAGRFFGFEVKRPGETARPLQAAVLRKIAAAGGLALVVTSVAEVVTALPAAGRAGEGE